MEFDRGCCQNSLWVNHFASKIGHFVRDGPKDGTAKKIKIQTFETPKSKPIGTAMNDPKDTATGDILV